MEPEYACAIHVQRHLQDMGFHADLDPEKAEIMIRIRPNEKTNTYQEAQGGHKQKIRAFRIALMNAAHDAASEAQKKLGGKYPLMEVKNDAAGNLHGYLLDFSHSARNTPKLC